MYLALHLFWESLHAWNLCYSHSPCFNSYPHPISVVSREIFHSDAHLHCASYASPSYSRTINAYFIDCTASRNIFLQPHSHLHRHTYACNPVYMPWLHGCIVYLYGCLFVWQFSNNMIKYDRQKYSFAESLVDLWNCLLTCTVHLLIVIPYITVCAAEIILVTYLLACLISRCMFCCV